MSPRFALIALVIAAAAGSAVAEERAGAREDEVERLTPEQLQAEQGESIRQRAVARAENALLRRRIEALERRNAANLAREVDLDAQLTDARARLAALRAARDD